MGFFDKLKKGLNKTRENLTNKIEKLVIGYADIDDDFLDELEETLIMADVGVQTTDTLMKAVRKGIKKKEINTPEDLKPFLQKEIAAILTKGEDTTRVAAEGPTVLLVIVPSWDRAGQAKNKTGTAPANAPSSITPTIAPRASRRAPTQYILRPRRKAIISSKLLALPDCFLSSFRFCFACLRACFFFSFSFLPNVVGFAMQSILIYKMTN